MSLAKIDFASRSAEFGPLQVLGMIVHVSDIHAVHGDAAWQIDQEMVLTELVKDLKNLVTRGSLRADVILLSGDLGARGGKAPEEYSRVREFVGRLRIAAELPKDAPVLAVPGNHDVLRTRPGEKKAHHLVDGLRRGEITFDDAVRRVPDMRLLRKRFANYSTLAQELMPNIEGDHILAWSQVVPMAGGLSVEIVGLNTALLCNDDRDRRTLRLGMEQIRSLQGDEGATCLRLAMMHHPSDWLEKQDRVEFEGWLRRYAAMQVYGHIHNPAASSVRSVAGDELFTVVAGAAHGDRTRRRDNIGHTYNLIVLCRTLDGRVIARLVPRVFSGYKEFRTNHKLTKENQMFAEFPLARLKIPKRRGGVTAPRVSKASRKTNVGLQSLSVRLMARAGRRRTAFPTDFSVQEMAERKLLVPTPLLNRSKRGTIEVRHTGRDLVLALIRRENVLVLGSPGGGKTVLAYEAALAILADSTLLPLVLDLRVVNFASIERETLAGLIRQLIQEFPPYFALNDSVRLDVAIIIDGLDERLAAGEKADEIASLLAAMARMAPILVTCRSEDYERTLAASVPSELFHHIYDIQSWSISGEFREFIERLAGQNLVDPTVVMGLILTDPELESLVERPLFARMLTYVIDTGSLPRSRTALYQNYLDKLSRATDVMLRAASCRSRMQAVELWREVAATIFFRDTGGADDMPVAQLLSVLGDKGISPPCGYRLLAAIMDIETTRGRLSASFIHYSFFEFLVAEHLALRLIELYPDRSEDALSVLIKHIPQEIRRHLTRILSGAIPDPQKWLTWLVLLYEVARRRPDGERRTAANMVAYMCCRLELNAAPALRRILATEGDPFLQNSLSWALARLDDKGSTWPWLERLGIDDNLASLNRGYLLYYLGDLKQPFPPYRDDEPFIDCQHTRNKLFEKLKEDDETRSAARRAVDLFSYLDLLAVREEKQSTDESLTTRGFLNNLAPHLDSSVLKLLERKLATTI